jgi:cytochrome c oxidase assembly protein subunit 15
MNLFQKTALAALLATVFLIFVGAVVRVSGAGLGCPDWPKCWGKMWPPSSIEEVDFDQIDMSKFQRRDPDITRDKLAAEFNPTHVWIEYLNRLTSLPVGLFTLATFGFSFCFVRRRPSLVLGATLAVVLVGANAWLGMKVVQSGLKPGIITVHMAMAVALLCVQVFIVHRGALDERIRYRLPGGRYVAWLLLVLFLLVVCEGVMGSQIREMTDRLALEHRQMPRADWIDELEQSAVYLVHRSFSWLVLAAALLFYFRSRGTSGAGAARCRQLIAGIVIAQMVLGVSMSQLSVSPVVQVLHVGLSSILVCALCWFSLCVFSTWSLGGICSRPRA